MTCIYCGNATQVTNSRKHKKGQSTWRRRECKVCHAIFTTLEHPDLSASIRVRSADGELSSFLRDTLFYSIAASCGHRKDTALSDAGALTDTIISNLVSNRRAIIDTATIRLACIKVLTNFDTAAASYYQAYFN